MILGKFIELCNHHHNAVCNISVTFQSPMWHSQLSFYLICFHSSPMATTILFSVCINLSFLNIPCKWNHTIYDVLCLTSFTWHHVCKVRPPWVMNRCLWVGSQLRQDGPSLQPGGSFIPAPRCLSGCGLGLSSCASRAPEHVDSRTVVQGLSCPSASGS